MNYAFSNDACLINNPHRKFVTHLCVPYTCSSKHAFVQNQTVILSTFVVLL